MVRHRRTPRIAVALAVTLSVFAFADGPAHACSCAIGDPRDALHASDAAFVGALVSKDVNDQTAIYTFSVETSVKGDLGDSVDVESAAYGAACGFEVRVGRRIGILLRLQGDGDWAGGLCTQIDPDVLVAAGEPLPVPNGEGPIRMIVGGNFGEARVLALDGLGRTLGYGYGEGDVLAVSMCPGMERFVEAVSFDGVGSLSVRETSTLEIVRDVPLITGRFPSIYQVACLSEDGGVLGAVTTRGGETQVHVVRGDRDRVAFDAERARAWFQGQRAYATVSSSVVRVALWGGDHRDVVAVPPGLSSPSVSRDERHVAGVRYGGSRPGRPPSEVIVVSAGGGADRGFSLRGLERRWRRALGRQSHPRVPAGRWRRRSGARAAAPSPRSDRWFPWLVHGSIVRPQRVRGGRGLGHDVRRVPARRTDPYRGSHRSRDVRCNAGLGAYHAGTRRAVIPRESRRGSHPSTVPP